MEVLQVWTCLLMSGLNTNDAYNRPNDCHVAEIEHRAGCSNTVGEVGNMDNYVGDFNVPPDASLLPVSAYFRSLGQLIFCKYLVIRTSLLFSLHEHD